MSKLIAPRRCPECGDPFTPRDRTGHKPQTCCGLSCSRAYEGRLHKGRRLTAAIAGRKRVRRERLQQQIQHRFGALTDRDTDLYHLGYQEGYTRGYNTGYHKRRIPAA